MSPFQRSQLDPASRNPAIVGKTDLLIEKSKLSDLSRTVSQSDAENCAKVRQFRDGRDPLVHLFQFPTLEHCLTEKG